MAAASFRLLAVLPAASALFTAWLLWELSGRWASLDATNQVLAVLLVLAALGFSALAFTILRDAFTLRPAAAPDTKHGHDRHGGIPTAP